MKGTIYGIGLGPGDPELVSLKAYNLIKKNKDIFFFRKKNSTGKVSQIAKKFHQKKTVEHVMEFPVTTEISFSSKEYKTLLSDFYDECCRRIKLITNDKKNVIVLCEGDPFFYGSFMHLYERLKDTEEIEIISGILGMTAAWNATKIPITWGDDVLTVVMGTMDEKKIFKSIKYSDAIIFMKIGRHFEKILRIIKKSELLKSAFLVEYASMPNEKVTKLEDFKGINVPYFSIIIIHGKGRRP